MKNTLLILAFIGNVIGVAAQSNDCATATPLTFTNGSVCVNGTTTNATSDNILYSTCNTTSVNEVWYTFIAEGANNDFTVTSLGMTNAQIVLYTGGCGVLLETCDNTTGSNTLNTSWGFAPGQQVWVGIMSNVGVEGNFELCIDSYAPNPGGGNTCAGAIPLCQIGNVYTLDMAPLTSSGTSPSCFIGASNQDIWVTFDVTQAGTIEWTADAQFNNVELDWALYDMSGGCPGPPGGPGNLIACNYNYASSSGAPIGMNDAISCTACPTSAFGGACGEYCAEQFLPVGTYAIMIDLYAGTAGNLSFEFTAGTTALLSPIADFTVSPSFVCGPDMTVNITDNSIGGAPDWTFGNGNTYSGSNPPSAYYNTPGTYAITATISGACPSSMTQFVQLLAPLAGNATPTDEICQNDCNGSGIVDAITGGDGVYTYQWYDAGMNVIPGETGNSIGGLCSGDYTVVVSNATCGTSINLPITVSFANTQDNAGFTTTGACDGGTSTITGTGGGTFSFGTPTGDGAAIDPITGTVTNGTSGAIYDILYTTNGTCPNSQNVPMNVLVTDNPSFTMAPECDGGIATITGTLGGSFNFDTPPVDAAVIDPVTGAVTGGTPGNSYDVEYVTGGTCPDSMVVTVVASNGDDATFNMTATCDGGTSSVSGTPGGSFSFDMPPGDGAVIDPITGTITNGTPGAQYSVEYLTAGNCPDSLVQQVTALGQDDPSFNTTPTCDGGTATITGDAGGSFSFATAPGDGAVIDPLTGAVTNGTSGTTYDIQYLTTGVCPDSLVVTVTAITQDDPSFSMAPTCDGGTASISGTSGGAFSFATVPGDNAQIDPSTGIVTGGNPAGNYDVIYVTSGTCPDSSVVNFSAFPEPGAPPAGTDTTYCSDENYVDMFATGNGTFTWYSDISLMNQINIGSTYKPDDVIGTTSYYVTETVNGCTGPASIVTITIESCEITIPTAITPGSGVNEEWEIVDLDLVHKDNEVYIYNRWGALIFEHHAKDDGPYKNNQWDGKYNGDPLPVGSYFFIIEYNDKKEPTTGSVSILR